MGLGLHEGLSLTTLCGVSPLKLCVEGESDKAAFAASPLLPGGTRDPKLS